MTSPSGPSAESTETSAPGPFATTPPRASIDWSATRKSIVPTSPDGPTNAFAPFTVIQSGASPAESPASLMRPFDRTTFKTAPSAEQAPTSTVTPSSTTTVERPEGSVSLPTERRADVSPGLRENAVTTPGFGRSAFGTSVAIANAPPCSERPPVPEMALSTLNVPEPSLARQPSFVRTSGWVSVSPGPT